MEYKNLIFDLGGVIIDLAVDRTINAFANLSGLDEARIKQLYFSHHEFIAYEKGEISDAEFRLALQSIFSFSAPDEVIDQSWNAMLAGLPKGKLELLDRLMNRFNLTVLSNTNSIHLFHVNTRMLPGVSGKSSLNDYFHQHYYSHLVNKRKPEKKIFMQVIEENKFNPAETLFLDDNPENIAAAESLGIQTRIIHHPDQVYQIFSAA